VSLVEKANGAKRRRAPIIVRDGAVAGSPFRARRSPGRKQSFTGKESLTTFITFRDGSSSSDRKTASGRFFCLLHAMTENRLAAMKSLVLLLALTCQPGDRLFDLRGKLPPGLQSLDLIVSVSPFYARLYIYEAGFPDSFQQCCSDKRTSVLKVPIVRGRFCVRQSQPQMTWKIRAVIKPDIEL
jgi:hypothetical protein